MLQHRLAHDDDGGEDALVQDLLLDGALSGLDGRGSRIQVLRYLRIKADQGS